MSSLTRGLSSSPSLSLSLLLSHELSEPLVVVVSSRLNLLPFVFVAEEPHGVVGIVIVAFDDVG